MSKLRLERAITLLLLGLLGAAWIYYSREPAQPTRSFLVEAPIVGHLAPDFTLPDAEGNLVSLFDYVQREAGDGASGDRASDDGASSDGPSGGRPVILNFWASWCGPCRIETPHFQELSLRYRDQVAILGINQGEGLSTITDFKVSFGLTYPLLYDADNGVNSVYNVFNLPTTIFIDRAGVVQEVYVGAISQGVLMERINRLVQE
ncbi:MAG: TlpA family protein disulfide reductase [Anaerolinea sp.]|nr:TlpA family protein disulfide reductase [Anaerolinea sp.]